MSSTNIRIDVLNASTEAADKTIKWLTAALQKQVTRDFAPVWGIDAALRFVPKGGVLDPNAWQLVFLDNADMAGALGYHDVTASGLPLGKVFIRTTELDHAAWSVTASHELLEMLGDPNINLTVYMQDTNVSGRLYAYETADAVELDELGYVINDFKMSDFVYPNWFEAAGTGSWTKFDFMGHLSGPFQLASGGYIGVYDVPNDQGWTQLFADGATNNAVPAGSRRARRNIPLHLRRLSTAHAREFGK